MSKVIKLEDVAALIQDGSTVCASALTLAGWPEEVAIGIEKRFLETGHPANLMHKKAHVSMRSGHAGSHAAIHRGGKRSAHSDCSAPCRVHGQRRHGYVTSQWRSDHSAFGLRTYSQTIVQRYLHHHLYQDDRLFRNYRCVLHSSYVDANRDCETTFVVYLGSKRMIPVWSETWAHSPSGASAEFRQSTTCRSPPQTARSSYARAMQWSIRSTTSSSKS